MRSIVGLFGVLCGGIVVALVSRYGFKTADNEVDGYIAAFLFGTIAIGGLGGHAVSVRVWQTSKVWALLIGMICTAALVVNLSNSLGAIAGRSDKAEAARIDAAAKLKDTRAELARKIAERDRLPAFVPTTTAMVRAAEAAVTAAEASRSAECEKRGTLCRQRETDEQVRRTELATASANAASTARADRLDSDIASLRAKIEAAGPTGQVSPHGAALARLFRLPDADAATAATWQQFAVAVIVELLIVGAFVSFGLMGNTSSGPVVDVKPQTSDQSVTPPAPTIVEQRQEPVMISPPRPQLVASAGVSIGNVPAIMAEVLHPDGDAQVELADAYAAYEAECVSRKVSPLPPAQFVDPLQAFCKACRIRTKSISGRVYLLGVTLETEMSPQSSLG